MSKVLDVAADPSTAMKEADDYSFDDFKREQAEASKNGKSVESTTPEEAPASERVSLPAETAKPAESAQPKQGMTDEEKSARKHANDGKRIPEFLKQISAKDAEIARLQRELADKRAPAPAAKESTANTEGAPDPKDPKYQGEGGWLQFVDDRADWKAEQKLKAYREQIETETRTKTVTEAAQSFAGKVAAYQEANPDAVEEFTEAIAIVREALENDFPEISGEIASHEKSPELIHYLGTNLDVFLKITSSKGKPMAMKMYRQVVKDFESAGKAPASEATTTKPLPKPPVNLNGRGRTPSASEIQDKAAEDDDFQTWQQAERSKPKQKGRWDR